MRALTALESAVLDLPHYRVSSRVRVQNGSSTLIDLSAHRGINWIDFIRYEEDIDQAISQAMIELKRDVRRPGGGADSALSLSPLRTDSFLNRLDDGVTYSPLLDVGRSFFLDVAVTETWRAPVAADWKTLLEGTIESIAWDRDPLTVVAVDKGKVLVDRWVEVTRQYGSTAGVAVETVMQSVMSDEHAANPLAGGLPTLFTPTSPSFLISPTQSIGQLPIMDALRLYADLIGWDVRYRWDAGTSTFRLTFQAPPRTKTTPDRTFGASRIFNVSRLMIEREQIRNAVTVTYGPNEPKPRPSEVRSDATSISKYGRRWMGIEEAYPDSPINTASEAGNLAQAVLDDLKDPKVDQEIEMPFFWPAELWDLYRFSANDIHYNSDQDLAVSTIRHELSPNQHRTIIGVRGKPAGHYLMWFQRGTGAQIPLSYPERRGATRVRDLVDGDGRVQSDLTQAVRQYGNGTTVRRIAKGHLSGTGKNGDVVTFTENFAAPPIVVVEGGITYEPRSAQWSAGFSSTLPQNFQREGVNISTSGFTLRGRLMQKGGSTARSHNFPSSNNLTAVGHTTALTLANAPSNNDQYTVHCSVSLTVTCTSGTETFGELVIAIDVMTDGSTWVERARRTYQESDLAGGGGTTQSNTHEIIPVTVTGVDSTDQIRIRIVSMTLSGSPGTLTASVHGFDGTGDPDSGVTYATATDSVATMTPDAQDFLTWHAMEVDS